MSLTLLHALKAPTPNHFSNEFLIPALEAGEVRAQYNAPLHRKPNEPAVTSINLVNPAGAKIPVQVRKELLGRRGGGRPETFPGIHVGKFRVPVWTRDFENACKVAGSRQSVHPISRTVSVSLQIPLSAVEHWIKAGLARRVPKTRPRGSRSPRDEEYKDAIDVFIGEKEWQRVKGFRDFGDFTCFWRHYARLAKGKIDREFFYRHARGVQREALVRRARLVETLFASIKNKRKAVSDLLECFGVKGKKARRDAALLIKELRETPGEQRSGMISLARDEERLRLFIDEHLRKRR